MSTNRYFEEVGMWPHHPRRVLYTYIAGFASSVVLTLAAYWIAIHHAFTAPALFIALAALALIQAAVQLICFLHVSGERGWRTRFGILGAIGIVVLILVGGSIWIMTNLSARMMPGQAQMNQYMHDQDGI